MFEHSVCCAGSAGTQISAHHQAKLDYGAISTILIFDTKRHMYCRIISDSIFSHFVHINNLKCFSGQTVEREHNFTKMRYRPMFKIHFPVLMRQNTLPAKGMLVLSTNTEHIKTLLSSNR